MSDITLDNLTFGKYHGLGNDYIIINDITWQIPEEKKSLLAQKLCQFHFSVGADGLIYVCNSEKADIRMRIFNDDGSEAEMCGNGIRCFSKYAYENDLVRKQRINIETLKGIMIAELNIKNEKVEKVKINMGPPILDCEDVPVISIKNERECINEPIQILDKEFYFTAVSMGNPHAVIFVDEQLTDEELNKYGALIEPHNRFPKKINVEFVKIVSDTEAQLRVFERGVGITNSCGTGTCAAVVAGTIQGIFKKNTPIAAHNDGGDLSIIFDGETVFMEGPVELAFKGEIEKITI
ncbi:MAG: diaminopimelate epimerase [Candidatus Hermodarchaeota archaeon]